MLDVVKQTLRGLFGRQGSGLSVPILDGAFKPNTLLEDAEVVLEADGLSDMALAPDGTLYLAAGRRLLALETGALREVSTHEAEITAITVLPDGAVAVALGDRILISGGRVWTEAAGAPFRAITALSPLPDGGLLVCEGSARNATDRWPYDLMEKGKTGRVLTLTPASGAARLLRGGLGWPHGAMWQNGEVRICESWRHRLVWGTKGDASAELPGYPARITPTADGGAWLSLFSGRAQIVEFLLQEDSFRAEMMATIPPEHWIRPALSSGKDFREPLQSGGVKHMGILKPWAPPRSYGLAVRLDAQGTPRMSVHSRVGGLNHGIVTTLEAGPHVYAVSKGAGRLLRMDLAQIRTVNGITGEPS